MGVLHSSRKVEYGEQNEYQCLHQGYEDAEKKDRQRGKESAGKQKKNAKQGFLGHDIAEKPDGQRQNPGQVAYDFNGEHQGNEPWNRSQEVLNIFGPMKLDTKNMGCRENDQGASQGDIDI